MPIHTLAADFGYNDESELLSDGLLLANELGDAWPKGALEV